MTASRDIANRPVYNDACGGQIEQPPTPLSRQGASQCHVYMVLPYATQFTTVGHFEVEPNLDGFHRGRFVYCSSYLDNPDSVPIDPVELDKLSGKVYSTAMFGGVFNSFQDASPQRWGRHVITQTAPLEPRSEIDYLLQSPDDRPGALGFGYRFEPPAPMQEFNKISDLEQLSAHAENMSVKKTRTKLDPIRIRNMMPFQTSMGGSRPKTVVEDMDGLWLAKFNQKRDRWSNTRLEHALLELAKICGIRSACSRIENVSNRDVLLVKRFDRKKVVNGYHRYRMISGYTILRTENTPEIPKDCSYAMLAESLRRIVSQPVEDSKELFRRMVFNALVSNIDDDPGSISLIAKQEGWKLSPAYDYCLSWFLVRPHVKPRRPKMSYGIHGRLANVQNLLSQCGRFLLSEEEATTIIDDMENQIRNKWYRTIRRAGLSEADCKRISPAFNILGFRQNPEEMVTTQAPPAHSI